MWKDIYSTKFVPDPKDFRQELYIYLYSLNLLLQGLYFSATN